LPVTLAGGLVAGFIAVTISISFAALIFTGDLEQHLPIGIGLALMGSAVVGIVTAIMSRFPTAVAGAQDNVTAILAVTVAAVASRVDHARAFATVIAAIVVASAFMGIVLYVVGRLRLGRYVRYMPFPVVGGFLAATGVLLVTGGLSVLRSPGGDFFSFDAVVVWGPGIGIGLAMYAAGRWGSGTLATPILLLSSAVVIRVGFLVGSVATDEATARGWLFGPFPGGVAWSPSTVGQIGEADWTAIGSEWIGLVSIAVVAVVSVLLYVHALEHEVGVEASVDRELRVGGVAGVAGAAVGGLPGFLYFSDSVLLHRIAGPRRGGAVLAASLGFLVLGFGSAVLSLVPRAVVGGVIIAIGLSFVIEWLWDARRTFGRVDHLLVVAIAATTVVFGFLPAIAVGIAVAVGVFVVRYSSVDVVRRAYPLSRTSSSVERTPEQVEALRRHGDTTRFFEVRGHLFFGTATALFDEQRLLSPDGAPVRRVVFDLTGVTGMDSSIGMALPKFDRAASNVGASIVFCGVVDRFRMCLDPVIAGASAPIYMFPYLDDALRWCEDTVLDEALGGHEAPTRVDLLASLRRKLGEEEAAAVLRHVQRLEVVPGDRVTTAGELARGLFFLEEGTLRVTIDSAGGEQTVLRRLAPGSLIGEVGLYRREAASATVTAETAGVIWLLDADDLDRLEHDDAATAAAVHRFSAAVLADRVIHAERGLRSEGQPGP
jgi:sulfate permease, SulP family